MKRMVLMIAACCSVGVGALAQEQIHYNLPATEAGEALAREDSAVFYIEYSDGKSDVTSNSSEVLNEMADLINRHPEWNIAIEVYANNTNMARFNKIMADRRSQTLLKELIKRKVNRDRVYLKQDNTTRLTESNQDAAADEHFNNRIVLYRQLDIL